MFLSFSIDVYVIFLYWNISMKGMHFIFICHLLIILQNFNIAFDYLLMLTIFHVQMFLPFSTNVSCDFLVLKHIDEVDALHLHLSLTYFLCGKYSTISILLLVIYWCWLFFMCKMFLSFLTDVYVIFLYWNILIKWMHFIFICHLLMLTCFNTAFDYLLMLTIFHVQNVLIILDWCLCDFLVLKHINEVDAFHLHLSFTDVDIFLCLKCSTISILLLIIYWCWLFFMCKMFLSFSIDVYVIFL